MNESVAALLESEAPIVKLIASKSECSEFVRATGISEDSLFLMLYAATDGYDGYDKRNDVRLWTKAEILEAFRSKEYSERNNILAFADFMLNDQVFLYDSSDESIAVAFENGCSPIPFSKLIESLRNGALPSIV